ncbi:MAG: hypothetical protein EA403_16360 [Spirochaetaceae bacterium]|nr:MAG: hypothetical protein EA403_16360 [Spirochaetaceae bacterium]
MERGGGIYGWTGFGPHVDIIDRYSVVEFPIYLKPRISTEWVTVYGLLGPQISLVLFDVAVDYRFDDFTVTEFERLDKRTRLGAAAGVGCRTRVGAGLVGLEIVYSHLFTSAFNDDVGPMLNGVTAYVSVGRLF